MKRSGIVITTFLAALALSPAAFADEYTPSEDAKPRGIMVGIGLVGGHTAYKANDGSSGENLNESYGAELHIAYMIGKKLAISAEGWGMRHQGTDFGVDWTITHLMATVGPQYWILPRMWLRGGFGYARSTIVADVPIVGIVEDESENVPAVTLGLGLEVISGRTFAMDVQVRAGTGFYENNDTSNVGLGVGLTWF